MKRILILSLLICGFLTGPVWADYDSKCKEVLPRGMEFTRNCQMIASRINFYNVVPAVDLTTGLVNAVVTMPAGTNVKWLVNKDNGMLKVEPVPSYAYTLPVNLKSDNSHANWKHNSVVPSVIDYLGVPGNYGIVPRTVIGGNEEAGRPSKPLDILIIGGPMLRGTVAKVKLIGAIQLLDLSTNPNENTYKLIAVLPGTPLAEGVNTLADLDAGASKIIQTWFENYQGTDVLSFTSLLEAGVYGDTSSSNTAWGVLSDCNTE